MDQRRNRRRWRVFGLVALVPVLVVVGFGVYLANLAGALPWQEEPTPIAADVTPFANLAAQSESTGTASRATPLGGTPRAVTAAPGGTPVGSPTAPSETDYAIVPEQSEARYVVKETVGRLSLPTEAVGRTRAVRGRFVLDADGRPLPGSALQVDLRTLLSGEGQRDNFIQSVTLKDAPLADFAITGVEDWSGPLADGQERAFRLLGEMTINGVTTALAFDTTATRSGDTVVGSAAATFAWDDFGLKRPNVAAQMISVEDTVRIELDITARAQ